MTELKPLLAPYAVLLAWIAVTDPTHLPTAVVVLVLCQLVWYPALDRLRDWWRAARGRPL